MKAILSRGVKIATIYRQILWIYINFADIAYNDLILTFSFDDAIKKYKHDTEVRYKVSHIQ